LVFRFVTNDLFDDCVLNSCSGVFGAEPWIVSAPRNAT